MADEGLISRISGMFQPTREEELADLLGVRGQAQSGPMQPGNSPQMLGGSGYLGGQQSPVDQAKLYSGMLGAGYNNQETESMMGMLNPDPSAQMFSPGFESPKDQIDAVNALRNPYTKAMTAPRKAINNFNDAVDIVGEAEFKNNDMLTGAESVALVKKYLKQVLPDESVMGDDIQTLLSSQGVSEQYKSVVNRFLGDSGTISRQGAQEIMKTMATMAQSGGVQRDQLRGQYTTEAGQYQLPTTFMGERVDIKQNPLSFEAWKKTQGY